MQSPESWSGRLLEQEDTRRVTFKLLLALSLTPSPQNFH